MKNRVVSTFLFIILSIALSYSSVNQDINKSKATLVTIDSLVKKIESIHNIKLFYKPIWFEDKQFRSSIAELSLDNCLEIINRITGLNCIEVNSTHYVFVPAEIRNYSIRAKSRNTLVIGDETELGNNSKATIFGKILDGRTGKPISGASLFVNKVNLSLLTDNDGNYSFTMPRDEYDLKITYAGFEDFVRKIQVKGNGIIDFEISEKSILLKDLEVTDKAANLNVIRTQMSTIKLNAKAIKELPTFMGEKDILKSMNLLPGVQTTGEFGTGFFVRGGSADQNLILIENVPLFNSSHLFGLSSVLNPDAVNNVTFLKAGIPAKLGERASSVLDIRLGNNPDRLTIKGGIGLLNTRLNLETPLFNKKVNLLIGGRSSYSNWVLHAMPDASLKKSAASFYDLNFLLTSKLSENDNLTLFGYISDDTFRFTKSSPYHYDNRLFSLRYIHNFNEKLNLSFIAGNSRYRNDLSESDELRPKEAFIIKSAILYNNSRLNFNWTPSKNHSVDIGAAAIEYKLQPGTQSALGLLSEVKHNAMQTEKALEMAAYISDNITISPKLSAELGVRFNNYAYLGANRTFVFTPNSPNMPENITDTIFYKNNELIKWHSIIEPRVSLRYALNDASSLKFSYNKISQFINLISNTAVMSPTDIYKLCSPNIEPLISNQFTLGYFRNFNKNAIEASVELYYKKLDNIVEYRDGATILMNNSLETDLLKASGYNYGIELYVKKNTGALTGWASYTYSRSMRHTSSPYEIDQINRNNYFPSSFDRPHNLVFTGVYHLTRRWWLSGTFNYNTGKPITLPELKFYVDGNQYVYFSDRNKYRLPDYHRLDLAITLDESLRLKRKWKGSWTLSILNVYGQKNAYSVYYKSLPQLESKYYKFFNLYSMYIIRYPIPTITYNFSF